MGSSRSAETSRAAARSRRAGPSDRARGGSGCTARGGGARRRRPRRDLYDRADLVVVDAVDDRDDEDDVDARLVQVVDGPELDVEEIAHLAMVVRLVAHAVELQIDEAKPRFFRGGAELRLLREADPV